MPTLKPVEHNPFGESSGTMALKPVDYDPFAAEKFVPEGMQDWTRQAAGKDIETLRNVGGVIENVVTLPQRAIDASKQDVAHFLEPGYEPQAVGPALETALLMMGRVPFAKPNTLGVAGGRAGMSIYDKALAEGKITRAEYEGFREAAEKQAKKVFPVDRVQKLFEDNYKKNNGILGAYVHDLIQATGLPKEEVHNWLLDQVKERHLTIHPSTSVDLPPDVMASGVRLPGFSEPFVNVIPKPTFMNRTSDPVTAVSASGMEIYDKALAEGRITKAEYEEFREAMQKQAREEAAPWLNDPKAQ